MTYEDGRRRGHAVVDRRSLRLAIKFSGLSQREIARRAGVAPSTISNLLGKRKTCEVETASRIAKVLEADTKDLFALRMFNVESTTTTTTAA